MANDKIIVIEPGDLLKEAIDKLEAKGFTVIECTNPDKIKILSNIEMDSFSGNDLFMAALEGANDGFSSKGKFAEALLKRLKSKDNA